MGIWAEKIRLILGMILLGGEFASGRLFRVKVWSASEVRFRWAFDIFSLAFLTDN